MPQQKGSHGTFVFPLRVTASAPTTPTTSPDPTLDVSNQRAIERQCGGVGRSLRQRSERTHVVTLLVLLQLLQQQRFLSSLLTPQLKKARGLAVRFSSGWEIFLSLNVYQPVWSVCAFQVQGWGPRRFHRCSTPCGVANESKHARNAQLTHDVIRIALWNP